MTPTRARRFGQGLVFIGYTLMVPAVLALLLTTSCAIMVGNADTTDADAGAAMIATGISWMFALGVYVLMIPTLILGLVLTMRRNVWRCGRCGYVFDRA